MAERSRCSPPFLRPPPETQDPVVCDVLAAEEPLEALFLPGLSSVLLVPPSKKKFFVATIFYFHALGQSFFFWLS
jgi:hypothetical protein